MYHEIAPFYNGKADLESVVGMLIKALTELTKRAISTATKIAADPMYSHDLTMAEGLRSCRERYFDEALDYLKQAMDLLQVHDIGNVDNFVGFATLDFDACEPEPFTEAVSPTADEDHGRIFPMAKIYDQFSNFGDTIVDILYPREEPCKQLGGQLTS
ncbi:hypothetical protein V6N13_047691 [Hibiscus sabdariffa]|uniref:Pectinesterase inhibitor domain-containing protein n=1 Tax=Hibiscus sabdariffa TaxID=183260 RepID=A0ABR2F4Y1_9ROSI